MELASPQHHQTLQRPCCARYTHVGEHDRNLRENVAFEEYHSQQLLVLHSKLSDTIGLQASTPLQSQNRCYNLFHGLYTGATH